MEQGAAPAPDLYSLPRAREGRVRRGRAYEFGLCLLVAGLAASAVTDAFSISPIALNVALVFAVYGWSRAAARARRLADRLDRSRAALAEARALYEREVAWRLVDAGKSPAAMPEAMRQELAEALAQAREPARPPARPRVVGQARGR